MKSTPIHLFSVMPWNLIKICYSRHSKSKLFGFRTENYRSVVKPNFRRFWTSEIWTTNIQILNVWFGTDRLNVPNPNQTGFIVFVATLAEYKIFSKINLLIFGFWTFGSKTNARNPNIRFQSWTFKIRTQKSLAFGARRNPNVGISDICCMYNNF